LDIDENGQLDEDELAKMQTCKPHLNLTIDFHSAANPGNAGATLRIGQHVPEVKIAMQPATDRAVLTLGTTRLVLSVHDFTRGANPAPAVVASQVRMMVHDQCDALCEVLDANADGRLGEREITTSPQRLLDYDANKNGQLEPDELPYTMIVAVMRGESPGEQSFYRPRSPAVRPSADAPAWFVHADFNGDGDVSRREFLGTSAEFSRLDANGNGYISVEEARAYTPLRAADDEQKPASPPPK
jgi:EF hand